MSWRGDVAAGVGVLFAVVMWILVAAFAATFAIVAFILGSR